MKSNRLVVIEWLEKAKELSPGEILYIPCDSKHQQEELKKLFLQELKVLAEINAAEAGTIVVGDTIKDKVLWVKLTRTGTLQNIAWLRKATGEREVVQIGE